MRRLLWQAALVLACWVVGISMVAAGSVDQYIQDLKSDNADIRAKAAYELGCT
jgi:hypothetical protein